eukprot:4063752-Amphidinium_carterae.1
MIVHQVPELFENPAFLRAAANTLILFRPDLYTVSTSSQQEVIVLTTSFLGPGPKLDLGDYVGDMALLDVASALGPAPPTQDLVSVVAMETRLAANCDFDDCYETGLMVGLDTAVEFPLLRFDYYPYYDPDDNTRQPYQCYMKHFGFVEGIEFFDNKGNGYDAAAPPRLWRQIAHEDWDHKEELC